MNLKQKQFLPSITTTRNSNWQSKIKEINQLNLKKAAVFPTCLDNIEKRQEFFKLLEKTGLEEIPFCHLRSDMRPEELDYLIKKWQVRVFNTHSEKEFPLEYDLSKYKDRIFIENTYTSYDAKEIAGFAGICLDFSHLENDRLLHKTKYKQNMRVLEQFSIGCNHISAIKKQAHQDLNGEPIYAAHYFEDLAEFDYLTVYPQHYFSNFIAMELENSLQDQLKAIDYICGLLNKNGS